MHDWKKGLPAPHKTMCGTPPTHGVPERLDKLLRKMLIAPHYEKVLLPDVDPSYKRPPALMYQIASLRKRAPVVYFVSDLRSVSSCVKSADCERYRRSFVPSLRGTLG